MSKQERSPEDSIQFLPDKESEKPYRERIDGIVQIVKRLTNSPSPFIYLDYLVKNDQQNNKVSLIVIIQLGDDKLYFELDLTNIDQSIEQEDLVKNKMREVFERQQKRSRYLLELSLQRSD